MANQDAAFGFRQVGGLGSRPTSEGTSKYVIQSGYTSAIYAGDIVELGAGTDESGAAIAAEIGTMKVTEQIDALKTLSTNPYNYLITPRIFAGIISLPVLVFLGDIIGVFGGYLICTKILNFNPTVYLQNTYNFVEFLDVFSGLVKAAVFGFIITFMGCYHGFNAKGGAQGVGLSTTYAVVSSSILILLMNYILTSFFFKL